MSDIRAAIERLPRFSLAALPTPLEDLPALTRHLGGPRILMKRDDLTGFALGGNKSRKLEFLVADALRKGCTTLLTAGAAQSNHCRQTAAAAAKAGLACELILGGTPADAALPPEISCWTSSSARNFTGPNGRGVSREWRRSPMN